MLPGMALIVTLRGSNYSYLEQIFMVTKGFEPSKFDCMNTCTSGFSQKAKTSLFIEVRYKKKLTKRLFLFIQFAVNEIHVNIILFEYNRQKYCSSASS